MKCRIKMEESSRAAQVIIQMRIGNTGDMEMPRSSYTQCWKTVGRGGVQGHRVTRSKGYDSEMFGLWILKKIAAKLKLFRDQESELYLRVCLDSEDRNWINGYEKFWSD